jgi:excisionase family DNA binding protein
MELITVQETARLLKVTPTTVRRYITAGRLPAVKVGRAVRVRKEAVETLLVPIAPRPPAAGAKQERGSGMKETERFVPPPLTAEERARGLAAVERLTRLQDELLARRGGKPFSPAWELLEEARAQRSRERS